MFCTLLVHTGIKLQMNAVYAATEPTAETALENAIRDHRERRERRPKKHDQSGQPHSHSQQQHVQATNLPPQEYSDPGDDEYDGLGGESYRDGEWDEGDMADEGDYYYDEGDAEGGEVPDPEEWGGACQEGESMSAYLQRLREERKRRLAGEVTREEYEFVRQQEEERLRDEERVLEKLRMRREKKLGGERDVSWEEEVERTRSAANAEAKIYEERIRQEQERWTADRRLQMLEAVVSFRGVPQ